MHFDVQDLMISDMAHDPLDNAPCAQAVSQGCPGCSAAVSCTYASRPCGSGSCSWSSGGGAAVVEMVAVGGLQLI